jgi:hypothetical protein
VSICRRRHATRTLTPSHALVGLNIVLLTAHLEQLRNAQGEIRIKLGPTHDGGAALLMMDRSTEPAVTLHTGQPRP